MRLPFESLDLRLYLWLRSMKRCTASFLREIVKEATFIGLSYILIRPLKVIV
jgi:hypothetical protein